MKRRGRVAGLIGALLFATAAARSPAADFEAWVLNRGSVRRLAGATDAPLSVGSLQKPFVLRAWTRSHDEKPPTYVCDRTSGCWRPSGHGAVDLRRAIRESCNTFFRALARATPAADIEAAFREAGFLWSGSIGDAEAIGLKGPAGLRIAPERLLAEYVTLARTPWPRREDVRQELLAGLKDAARDGTAEGVRLFGLMAKTGTIPAIDGKPLATTGLALVFDDTGFAALGRLIHGTGRETAVRVGRLVNEERPGMINREEATLPRPLTSARRPLGRSVPGAVRISMLDELRARDLTLVNVGPSPISSSRGFIGAGAVVVPAKGDRFAEGDWEIRARSPEFERRVKGAIEFGGQGEFLRATLVASPRDYVNGVLRAELGTSRALGLRAELAAAALRFLARGARHTSADVCDSTHCAWFVGEGPVPRWLRPDQRRNEKTMAPSLSDEEWERARALAAAETRPDQWTADCGGDPVSPHFIWGNGVKEVVACPRHAKGSGRVWRREWPTEDLIGVFGTAPRSMEVTTIEGVWTLKVRLGSNSGAPDPASRPALTIGLVYDDAHRRLAAKLGWDALPAPASRVTRTSRGFVAEGVGFGHRVGLCLGER